MKGREVSVILHPIILMFRGKKKDRSVCFGKIALKEDLNRKCFSLFSTGFCRVHPCMERNGDSRVPWDNS